MERFNNPWNVIVSQSWLQSDGDRQIGEGLVEGKVFGRPSGLLSQRLRDAGGVWAENASGYP